jgi:integrase
MLTDTACRNARAEEKDYSLPDGNGLRLLIRASGSRLWQYRYRLAGKASIYSIGSYPEVTLLEARKAAACAREQVEQGINPAVARKVAKLSLHQDLSTTFRQVAEEWVASKQSDWAPHTYGQVTRFFETDVYPAIGDLPIKQVNSAQILSIIKKAEKRGAETVAVLIRQWCSAVFRYATSTLRADGDPAAALRGAISKPKTVHAKALTKDEIAKLATALEKHGGGGATQIAMKLLLLTFVRTGELRGAEWSEIDFDRAEWRIPAARMKKRELHIVPLSQQARALFVELHAITGKGKYLFPNVRRRNTFMNATTINRALERMGFIAIGFSGHGFRATASTMLNEMGYRSDLIERQLAHAERNQVRASYNQAEYLIERRAMMQHWSDICVAMMMGDKNVVLFKAAA